MKVSGESLYPSLLCYTLVTVNLFFYLSVSLSHSHQQHLFLLLYGEESSYRGQQNEDEFGYSYSFPQGHDPNQAYSYPDETEDGQYYNDNNDTEKQEEEMPVAFYQEVESFLSKGPPKLRKGQTDPTSSSAKRQTSSNQSAVLAGWI
jgi:hypothetical protein